MASPADREIVNPKSVVQSLAKGFQVLEAFDMNNAELNLTQISNLTGLDAGTVFRIVNTLLMLGYLEHGETKKNYRLAIKVVDLGFHAIGRRDMRDLVRPYLRSLVGEVSEAASFCVLDGPDVVYVERVHAGLARLGVDIRIGSRIPAYYTAIGHSILAYLPETEVNRILTMRDRVKLTPKTTTSIAEIDRRLELVRQQGYAFSDQDTAPMLRVIAAPILDADDHPVAALSVAAPSLHMSAEQFVVKAVEPLLRAAAEISQALSVSGSAVVGTGSAFR